MSNVDDIFGATSPRNVPAQGRRAGRGGRQQQETLKPPESSQRQMLSPSSTSSTVSQLHLSPEENEYAKPDRPKRRRQMWNVGSDEEVTDERLIVNDGSDSDDIDIPVIPELEELEEEAEMEQIAAPPTTIFKDLVSYQELDKNLMRQSAFQMLDDAIDLKLFTKALVPAKDLVEPDEAWDMSQLFTEMHSMVTCCSKIISEQAVESKNEVLI